jgi:myo-inositol-1-phosphate synthase
MLVLPIILSVLGTQNIAHFALTLKGFGGAPVKLDAKLQVEDSPNSAGVVIDAIRYLKVALDLGLSGPLYGPSAFTQKSPPIAMTLNAAQEQCTALSEGRVQDLLLDMTN